MVDPRTLEPIAARGWPAAQTGAIGGWRLHAAAGFSGRINACWPIDPADRPPAEAIAAAEAWYAARGLPPMFKIVEGAAGATALIRRLSRLGYRSDTPTLTMVGPVAGEHDPAVAFESEVSDAFRKVFEAAQAADPGDAQERLEAMARIPRPRAFARLDLDGAPAAIGACAVEAEWTGVFGMRTAPERRRLGLGGRIFAALMSFSRAAGATRAYLQVDADNAPAIALYEKAGFETAYLYHYWRRGVTSPYP